MAWASAMIWDSLSYRWLFKGMGLRFWHTHQPSLKQQELLTGRWDESLLFWITHAYNERITIMYKPMQTQTSMYLFPGFTPCTGNRDPVFCPGGGAGRPAPRKAIIVWPRPGGGPVGWGAGRLRRGEARHGAGGNRPGEGQQHQEEHAGPTAPQRHWFLSQSGEDLTTREVKNSNSV